MFKKSISQGLIVFVIMTAVSLIMKGQNIDPFQVRSTFFAGIISAVIVATKPVYDIENWSLLKQSLVHFGLMLVTVYPVLLLSGWFTLNSPVDYLKVLAMFLLGGVITWTIGFLVFGKLLNK
ncbi:MAG: DUF3021 family protein [Bacillota bacterium]|nr:DUF3021 family protein [Bacillota bacterium]